MSHEGNDRIYDNVVDSMMTLNEIQERIETIERKIKNNSDLSMNFMFILAGEWEGLNKVLGNKERAISLLWRLRGI
tara:strand:- start:7015 stop:7242 length:228 start_codon:yes stop_codon:yes gene_type:complete